MKTKFLVALLLSCTGFQLFAQDESKKPDASSFTAEVNLNPFSASPININYLRFRYFVKENAALRIGFSIGMENQNPVEDITRKTFEFNIRPGYEWHLPGTDRLSPYFGVEADIAIKSSSFEDTSDGAFIEEIDGAWSEGGNERAYKRFGLNAIIGADFYIMKRVYLGTEFGFGFQKTNFEDIKVTFENDEQTSKGGSNFQLGPNFNSSIRLGFVF